MGIFSGGYNAIISSKIGRILTNTFGVFAGVFTDAFYALKFAANKVFNTEDLTRIIMSGLGQLFYPTIFAHNYGAEQMADSFAADYGFGPDLTSAFLKIEKKGQELDILTKVPILNAVLNLWSLPFTMLIQAFDGHPSTGARIRGITDIMKSDLSKGYYDPRAKKALEKYIQKTEKAVADFQDNLAKNPLEYNKVFSSAILCFLFNNKGGLKYNAIKINHSEEKQQAFERNQNQATGNVIKI